MAGTVRYAGQPLGDTRVELRPLGWIVSGADAVASAESDANGMFTLPNPPAGDWSVVGVFPDGEVDAGGWPPVSIVEGQAVLGFIVPIERKLTLLSPVGGATTSATPTFSWQPAADATTYRVWVLDAGTTEMAVDQTTTATELAPGALAPGTYQWVVNATDAAGEAVATGSETFVVGGAAAATPEAPNVAAGLPPTCQPHAGETMVYADRERGFCFLYPARFTANTVVEGQINVIGSVRGPALDGSPDPLQAMLLIEAAASEGLDLKAATEELLREFQGQPGITIKQRPFDLGGTPAVLLEGVPGRGGSRDIVAMQNGLRFRLLFMPDPEQFPAAAADVEALFDAVAQSFTFFAPAAVESGGPVARPGAMPRLPDQDRAFAAAREALAKELRIDELAVQRVEVTPQEWNDACLGVTRTGEMCAQVITPGWLVIMDVGSRQYEAHTDREGRQVRLVGVR